MTDSAQPTGPLLIAMGTQANGVTYQLHPLAEKRLREAGIDLPVPKVFLGLEPGAQFEVVHRPLWWMVVRILTGRSEEELAEFGGVAFWTPMVVLGPDDPNLRPMPSVYSLARSVAEGATSYDLVFPTELPDDYMGYPELCIPLRAECGPGESKLHDEYDCRIFSMETKQFAPAKLRKAGENFLFLEHGDFAVVFKLYAGGLHRYRYTGSMQHPDLARRLGMLDPGSDYEAVAEAHRLIVIGVDPPSTMSTSPEDR